MEFLRLLSYVWHHPLNAESRWAALGRVVRWQLASRLMQGPIAFPFVEGTSLLAVRGMWGATGNWYCGLHEAEEMAFILHFLREDELFVDIGSNVGSYTVLAAGGVGSHVISIEPIPATFSVLQRNVLLNELTGRVDLHDIGLSSRRSELRFTSDLDTLNHVMADAEEGNPVHIQTAPLDGLLDGRVPSVVKIDVEGYEREVLIGGAKTFSHPGVLAVIMEVNGSGARYGERDDELLIAMQNHGFEPYSYEPLTRILGDWKSTCQNAIFLRDREAAQVRVRNAKRFRLCNGMI